MPTDTMYNKSLAVIFLDFTESPVKEMKCTLNNEYNIHYDVSSGKKGTCHTVQKQRIKG